jgi:F-type H+-transporting ATPase subunit alpha
MNSEYKALMDKVSATGEYGDDIQTAFKEALDKFMETQTW